MSRVTPPGRSMARIGRSYTVNNNIVMPERPDDGTIVAKIITEYKNLNRKDIDAWRQALRAALDPLYPRRFLLQDVYDDLETDGHLKCQFFLRDMATLGHPFEVIDDNSGEKDDETTKIFKSKWFYNFMRLALGKNRKGTTVLELTDPAKMTFKLIPRRNVVPDLKLILFQVNAMDGIFYDAMEDRIIQIGEDDDLGIMNDIAPQLIWKRNSQQSWAEFSEKFGMPLVTATTNKTNQRDLDKLDSILAAMGEAARAVLPAGTSVDVKPFAGKDSYQVYNAQIERCNSEISKPIVGGTMTTDNGSSRSQSEVHERNLDDKIAQGDLTEMAFLINDTLIPLMRRWGWKIPENRTFVFPESFELSLKDHWAIVKDVLQFYDVPAEWISKTFNIPISKVKEVMALPKGNPDLPGNDPEDEEQQEDGPPVNDPPVKSKKPKKVQPAASFFD